MSDQLAFVCNDEACPWGTGSVEIGIQCSAEEKASLALREYFKYSSFRPGQLDAVLPALHKKDVFVRMATGSGKSLCMYLVPLVTGNSSVGIIISPLIGLIGQQVRISVNNASIIPILVFSGAPTSHCWCFCCACNLS